MVKYLLGVATGVLLIFLLCLVAVIVAITAGGGAPAVADNSVLELELSGGVREHISSGIELEFLRSGPPATLLGLRSTLQDAAEDDRIGALALRCGGLAVGWGKAQELRWQIEKFKESGKPVMGFMQVAGTMDYFVCSAADELYMEPEGMLDMKGLRAEVAFYKDTFEKIGVDVEMERIGKYKSAAEPYTQTGMSEAFREVTNSVLDEMLRQLSETVAPSRGMTPEEFLAALDQGPFLPDGAKQAGLIDDLLYQDQFHDRLEERAGVDELETISRGAYAKATVEPFELGDKKQIAVVYGVGAILRGESEVDPLLGVETLGADSLVDAMKKARENENVEAIVLRIDSPGGDAIASDQMWRALELAAKEKPVVVSMSDVAASGGYYMAMANGVPVLAYPGCYTGSIGVFFGKLNRSGRRHRLPPAHRGRAHQAARGRRGGLRLLRPKSRRRARRRVGDDPRGGAGPRMVGLAGARGEPGRRARRLRSRNRAGAGEGGHRRRRGDPVGDLPQAEAAAASLARAARPRARSGRPGVLAATAGSRADLARAGRGRDACREPLRAHRPVVASALRWDL